MRRLLAVVTFALVCSPAWAGAEPPRLEPKRAGAKPLDPRLGRGDLSDAFVESVDSDRASAASRDDSLMPDLRDPGSPDGTVMGSPGSRERRPNSFWSPLSNRLINEPLSDLSPFATQCEAAVLPVGDDSVLAVYFDSGSVVDGSGRLTGWSLSLDGGATFEDRGAIGSHPSRLVDQAGGVLARDPFSARVYLATLGPTYPRTVLVYRTNDPVTGFQPPVAAYELYYDLFMDRPWITVDGFPGPGNGNVYVLSRNWDFWMFPGMRFSTSTDGGSTFASTANQVIGFQSGEGPSLTVAPDHTVHAFWFVDGQYPAIVTRRTSDFGATFAPAVVVSPVSLEPFQAGLGLEISAKPHPQAVASSAESGRIVVVFADDAPGVDHADVYYSESFDGGQTWTGRERVHADSGTNDQFSPTIAMTPDGARVLFTWYDRRRDPQNWEIGLWGRIAEVESTGLEFGHEFPIATESSPPVYRQDPLLSPGNFMGEFGQSSADAEYFYVAWTDTRLGDTFHRNQPDVRFAKIPVEGPGAVLTTSGATFRTGSCTTENDAPEPGESVSYSFCLENIGSASTEELTATLLAARGVTSPGPPQILAPIEPHGNPRCLDFSFTVDPTASCGGEMAASIALSSASARLALLEFPIRVGDSGTATYGPFENPEPITIPEGQVSIPYPSEILVSGVPAGAGDLSLALRGFSHPFSPRDIDMMLTSPSGASFVFLSFIGGFEPASTDLLMRDDAISRVPLEGPLSDGTFQATNYGCCDYMPPPAPTWPNPQARPAGLETFSSTFGGGDPNGIWELYAKDRIGWGGGSVDGGWTLEFRAAAYACRCEGPYFAGDFEVGDTSQWTVTRH
ncbi:MAG: hypothetical protein DCC48_18425 [Acidobacteria bacterium]|nr:MAG: hypothetical protein DCC48_18425 [Acidobacteriota bacterium]